MKLEASIALPAGTPSEAARARLLSQPGEPLFVADWERVLMVHLEVDAAALQREVPFALDLWEGRAFVSLVAFTMRGMRPRAGGRVAAWLFRPLGTHEFLNVRTYVRHDGEPGIFFLAEWLANRLSVPLGPRLFGLPYRFGRMRYEHAHERGELRGRVSSAGGRESLAYRGSCRSAGDYQPCAPGTREEFLMERYTAFTQWGGARRYFRVWHAPWPQQRAEVIVEDDSLLTANWPWIHGARCCGANYSPGIAGVWMGWPHRCAARNTPCRHHQSVERELSITA